MKTIVGEFGKVEIPARIQKAAPVTIDGELVGYIIDPPGEKQFLLSFNYGSVRGMRCRQTVRQCMDEAEAMYKRATA